MSKKDDKSKDRPYEVGYKRPPKQHQFKPKSRDEASEGAPRRKRQKHKKTQTKQVDLARLFAEPVAVAKGGRVVNMDPFEIMLRKQIEMAIKHRDHAAAKAVIDEAAKWDLLSTPPPAPGGGVLLVPLNSEEDLKRYQETFFPTDDTDSTKWEGRDE
jgi:hypothetical protein